MTDLPAPLAATAAPATADEAVAAGSLYFAGRPCHRGHAGLRFTRNGTCVECQRAYTRARRRAIRAGLQGRKD